MLTLPLALGSLAPGTGAQAGDNARAWGQNGEGELGNGTTIDSSTPVAVGGLSNVVAIAAGVEHTLALLSNGTVMAWGFNGNGELGNGTTTESSTPVAVGVAGWRRWWSAIRPVSGLADVVAIAAGDGHSLALLSNGTVMAWGSNSFGQLGNGTTTDSSTPVAVGGLSNVVAIAAGTDHSLALLSNGTVMAWGSNSFGQLGNPDAHGIRQNRNYDAMAAGPQGDYWGTTTFSSTPVAVNGLAGVAAIAAGDGSSSESVGAGHSLALLSNGTVMAWGFNSNGELGNGTTTESSTPVAVSGLAGVAAIAAGAGHSLALLSNGTAMAWGYNTFGQLGNGTTTDSSTPVALSGLSGAKTIATGGYHNLALLSNGAAMAWGFNKFGQLGNGSTTDSSTPVAVNGHAGVAAIAAGRFHSLALVGPAPTLHISLAGAGRSPGSLDAT